MSVTGKEPAKIDDLRVLAQSLGREVLFAGYLDAASSNHIETSADFSEYSDFIIEWSDSGGSYSGQVPCIVGQSQTVGPGLSFYPAVNGARRFFYCTGHVVVTRIIGIRNGGGQLLADLIAAMGGDAE